MCIALALEVEINLHSSNEDMRTSCHLRMIKLAAETCFEDLFHIIRGDEQSTANKENRSAASQIDHNALV